MKSICLLPWAAVLALAVRSVLAADAAVPAGNEPVPITLERIHADPPLAGSLPRSAKLSPGGRFVSYLQPSAADSEVLELWVQPLPAGAPRRVAAVADLIGTRQATLSEAERMALERRRIGQRGITSYDWCGEQDRRLVVPLAGDLYLIELDGLSDGAADTIKTTTRRLTFDEAEPERDPRCDAGGTQIAFVKRNDLWVQALAGGDAKQLTRTGSDTMSTGLAEFIAAEEFDRFDGYWWSRDGRRLLTFEVDEHEVPMKTRMQIRADGSEVTKQRYPAAGDHNAVLRPLLIDVTSGRTEALATPPATEYLVRAGWFNDGTPWLQALNREQTELQLVEYLPSGTSATPQAHTLLVERDPAWVDVRSDLRELPPGPAGTAQLLWSSERSGKRQLWQLDRAGGAPRQLTDQSEPVTGVVCAGAGRIVFAAERQRGRAQELFVRDSAGKVSLIEPGPVQRWRSATADSGCTQLLVQESAWGQAPTTRVLNLNGRAGPKQSVTLIGTAPDPLLARIVPEVQTVELMAADGRTPLNAFYLPPLKASANPAGHAVIVSAYGGPGVGVTVAWRWTRSMMLYAYWQRLGFGVLLVDNRGMMTRDRDYSHAHYRAFGKVEVDDLYAAVRQLPGKVQGVDPARIGFIGWSYGGTLGVRMMLDDTTPFAAAVAGAPVVDQALYDTAYTERYLGLPDGGNAAPYKAANLLLRAKQLSKPLMLMHGTADDNVLFENSLRLISALQAEGKLFETVIYPGQAHGVQGRVLQLYVDRASTDFFVRHLQP